MPRAYLRSLSNWSRPAPRSGCANQIDPYALNEVDQRMLKEAFRQARKLQQRLQSSYQL
jgi:signal-transduction protein with cAMP-binding, CBS, and nucleotidyltransferase domain